MPRHKHPSKTQSKAQLLSPGKDGEAASDDENSDDELIVPVPGLTPSLRWEVQAAEKRLFDEFFPADPSSKNASDPTLLLGKHLRNFYK
jgi:hypothetical protein